VIAVNKERYAKTLWSDRGPGEPIREVIVEHDREEAEVVAEDLLAHRNRAAPAVRPWRDFAILYRSNAQSRLFEEALRRHQIPYKIVGGMSFLDRKEIKDVLCYWRLVANFKDDASLRRILNYPTRGIGKSVIEKLGTLAFEQQKPFFEALSDAPGLALRGASGCIQLRDLVLGLRQQLEAIEATPEMLSHWAMRSLETIGIKRAIEQEEEDPAVVARKWESVEDLVHSLGQLSLADFEGTALDGVKLLHDFLARMTLDAAEAEEDKKDREKKEFNDEVTLLTLHGAKGLEYPIVYLVGMEEGFLPHKRTIEEASDFSEERRLCYVGITRARDHLILTRAKNRIRYGKPVPRYPSRFIADIPKELMLTKDESHSPDLTNKEVREEHEVKVKNFLADIRARLQQ
jgi:superfamily I DNA/RNA helicase